jgi:hypothetical protein
MAKNIVSARSTLVASHRTQVLTSGSFAGFSWAVSFHTRGGGLGHLSFRTLCLRTIVPDWVLKFRWLGTGPNGTPKTPHGLSHPAGAVLLVARLDLNARLRLDISPDWKRIMKSTGPQWVASMLAVLAFAIIIYVVMPPAVIRQASTLWGGG